MALASVSKGGVWGSQPVIGIMGDYYSNPALLDVPHTAETHGDLLLDAPTSYVGDAYKLNVLPSFRVSNAQGYSTLDSNYQHLNVSNEFDNPRGSFTVTLGAARDSSLNHDYLLDGSTGVRRDSLLGEANWDHQLSERLDIDTDANWTRVLYGTSNGTQTLNDYKYESIAPTLSWAESERGKLTATAGAGRYNSIDGRTESISANAQLGFSQKLTEIWTLSAAGGYSRANNRANYSIPELVITPEGIGIVLVPVTLKTTQNGSVYNVTLNRQTTLLSLSAVASQQLSPTGFAFLARQSVYQIQASYTATPRWTIGGDVHRISYEQPAIGPASGLKFNVTYIAATAAWAWSEHWNLTLTATRVMERYISAPLSVASTGVSIELSRRFDWKPFQ